MVRYLTFAHFNVDSNDNDEIVCVIEKDFQNTIFRNCSAFVRQNDVAIVPRKTFYDKKIQEKILYMAQNDILSSDYGVKDFCSEITIAGYLYVKSTQRNQLYSKIKIDKNYHVKKSDIYEIYSILRHVRNAKFNGFQIFDELKKKEYYEIDKNYRTGDKVKIISRNIREEYARSVFKLLTYYEDDLKCIFNIILDSPANREIIYKCILNDCYLYYFIIILKPALKYTSKSNAFFDFDEDLKQIKELTMKVLSFLANDKDYPMFLNIWYSQNNINFREQLYERIANLLNKFNDQVQLQGRKYYDCFFNYLIEKILFGINNKILDCFTKLNHFFFYGSLKYEIINNYRILDCFDNIYNNFTEKVKQSKFSNIDFQDSKLVLRNIFFGTDSLICSKGINNEQYKIVTLLTKEIQRIDFEAVQYEFCRDEILEDHYELPSVYNKFKVLSDKYKEGTLLISRDSKLHLYKIFFTKENLNSQNFEIKQQSSLKIFSKRITIFYDKFYLYAQINGKNPLIFYYNNLFLNIDTAIMILVFYLLKVSKFNEIGRRNG